MKKYGIFVLLLIFIFSIGAIAAADTADEVLSDGSPEILEISPVDSVGEDNPDILEIAPDDVSISDSSVLSFSDLNKNITDSVDSLEIDCNYRFDNQTDSAYAKGIYINKDDFTINGNNHIIDANHLSAIFVINATNVTINNLIFKNAYSDLGSVFYINPLKSLTTNNVTFENNTGESSVVFAYTSGYCSNNDKFIDSAANSFGVITLYQGAYLEIHDALMMSSRQLKWGFIQSLSNSFIYIYNSTFANTTSKYSTAVKGDNETVIENCRFINLHALMSAGAIGIKTPTIAQINNCTFINVTSAKNGGAIFVDAYNQLVTPEVNITDSIFVDCASEFGGAILQLEGNLTINNCNFTNNSALFDGGAIYTSWTNVFISDSRLNNNSALYDKERGSFGGAIFCDMGYLELEECELINNSAQHGGALYLYDSSYRIEKTTFNNNLDFDGNYDDMYTVFDKCADLDNATNTYSSNESLFLNDTFYSTIMANQGMKLNLIDNSIDIETIPFKFDLRDWGWVTPIRDQGQMGACWAFGSSSAMESAILRYIGLEMDISENNLKDLSYRYNVFGVTHFQESGLLSIAVNYALSWFGVFPSEFDEYDELGKVSPIFGVDSAIHFQDVVLIPARKNSTDNDLIKQSILKYGAIGVSYTAEQTPPYLNPVTSAQYCNESKPINHGVAIIGWDDHYSKENFNAACLPPGDGAWIIKNSWGEIAGDEGYYYVSYYDVNFARYSQHPLVAYVLDNTVEYNKNYQYDVNGYFIFESDFNANEYCNNFVAVDDDLIAGVGTYFNESGVEYTVEIYVNDELKLTQTEVSPFSGYHTIKLNSYVPIRNGDEFSVKIKSNAVPVLAFSRQHYIPGTSQINNHSTWLNITDYGEVCCIKAYTVADTTKIINNNDVSMDYGSESYFSVKVVTDDGHAVGAGAIVKFSLNGKTIQAVSDGEGIAKIKITEAPGTYKIITSINGKTYTNTVTVKAVAPAPDKVVLTAYKATVKKTAKKFILKAKLKINGKLVKGKKITFKFNGKTYKAKTDKKGIAKVTIKKSVIKKLKKGKKYTVKVTYLKNTKKAVVKVK